MKRLFITLSLIFLLFLPINSTKAITTGAMFGGFVVDMLPCTCSTGWFMHYIPYFFGPPVPGVGTLYIPPTAIIYEFFQLLPGTWELGMYTPGVSACLITAPNPADPCVPVITEGTVQYTGTSSLTPMSLLQGLAF